MNLDKKAKDRWKDDPGGHSAQGSHGQHGSHMAHDAHEGHGSQSDHGGHTGHHSHEGHGSHSDHTGHRADHMQFTMEPAHTPAENQVEVTLVEVGRQIGSTGLYEFRR